MRRRIPGANHFPPGTNHPAIPRNPPFARPHPHAFSLMYSQIFVSNATLSFSQQPRPSQARTGMWLFACTCSIAREYANGRDGRSSFFPPSVEGAEFISRPNALVSHERHPRSIASIILTLFLAAHPFSRSPTTARRWKRVFFFFFFFSISILRFRSVTDREASLYVATMRTPIAEIHRRGYIQKSQMDFTYIRMETLLKFTKEKKNSEQN